jgi:dTMP kinase
MSSATEALLMLADRAHHVTQIIEPTLAGGRHVVSDRYFASTLAYQGFGGGLDLETLRAATELAIQGCRPQLTVLIDLAPELAHERRARDDRDRFESADLSFHHRVREGYLEMANQFENWVVIDGSGDVESVSALVDSALATLTW